MPKYLIIAHQTATSPQLEKAVVDLAQREEGSEFWLVVPATPVDHLATWTEGESHAVAAAQAESARKALEAVGVRIVAATVGAASPVDAVRDALMAQSFDAIVISTLHRKLSRWLRMDAVHRLEREVDIPIIHVEAEE